MAGKTYWLREWRQVSEEEWVRGERRAGFIPRRDQPRDKPITGGFSGDGIEGSITKGRRPPNH